MSEITELLAQLIQDNKEQKEKAVELETRLAKEREDAEVTLKAPDVDQNVVRSDKIQKLNLNMRRSQRVKPYKVSGDIDIKLFLKKFDEELINIKALVGLAGENLEKDEWVPIFRSCLEFPVVERVEQILTSQAKKWEDMTEDLLVKLMKEEFGEKQTEVAKVISMFGTQRLTKSPNEKVSDFYFKFMQNIPEIMKPIENKNQFT